MNKDEFVCKKCEFYNKESDSCILKDVKNCSKEGIKECTDYLVNNKLIYF